MLIPLVFLFIPLLVFFLQSTWDNEVSNQRDLPRAAPQTKSWLFVTPTQEKKKKKKKKKKKRAEDGKGGIQCQTGADKPKIN
ncbi:hypothetical protein F5H01DRAFT_17286 [Linnemannia elongata]|nr:hypothetical protein F5H01DRAFT_17286 [Linnemannia elongata]